MIVEKLGLAWSYEGMCLASGSPTNSVLRQFSRLAGPFHSFEIISGSTHSHMDVVMNRPGGLPRRTGVVHELDSFCKTHPPERCVVREYTSAKVGPMAARGTDPCGGNHGKKHRSCPGC